MFFATRDRCMAEYECSSRGASKGAIIRGTKGKPIAAHGRSSFQKMVLCLTWNLFRIIVHNKPIVLTEFPVRRCHMVDLQDALSLPPGGRRFCRDLHANSAEKIEAFTSLKQVLEGGVRRIGTGLKTGFF